MSNILVIGHTVLDKIYFKNVLTEKPGGIFHSVNTLVNICENEDRIFLITQYSKATEKHFNDVYDKVDLRWTERVDDIPTVSLTLYENKERDEKYSTKISPLKIPSNIDLTEFDIIYVNMISGFDLTVKDLNFLRKASKCKIYFDLHTLSRGFDNFGNRVFRQIPNPIQWLENVDILQMNVNEKETIFTESSEKENLELIFKMGVENIIITDGGNPVKLFAPNNRYKVDAIKVKSSNFVGCGDTFGAAFCIGFAKNKNIFSALKFANFVAGISTTYNSPNEYKNLKKDVKKRINQK